MLFPCVQTALYPFRQRLVCALVLGVLRLCERHLLHGVAVLVGEDNHDVLAGEIMLYLVGQTFEGVLVRHGALARRDDNEQMVIGDGRGKLRHLRPVLHQRERHAHLGMAAADKLLYQLEHVGAPEELGVALHVGGHAAHALQPAVEARLKLRPRRDGHENAAYGGQRLLEARHDYLRVESVEEALVELAPELLRHLRVHVHSDEDVGGAELLEGVAYAVGDVGRHAHLRLHRHVGGGGIARHALKQHTPLLHVAAHVGVVVHDVQPDKARRVLRVAHHHRHVDKTLRILGILHRHENLLVGARLVVARVGQLLVAQDNLLGGALGHHRGDDAREENHYHHAVEHVVGDERTARLHLYAHSYHHHGDGSGGMGRREAEHHVARRQGQAEDEPGEIGGCGLAKRAGRDDEQHHHNDVAPGEQQAHVDEHSHADEEIGYEEGVADELDAVHERRHVGDEAVENQARHECAEDALQTDGFAQGGTHEEHRHDEDELHHGIAVAAQKPARQARDDEGKRNAVEHELSGEPQPEQHARVAIVGGHHGGERDERHKQRYHRRAYRQRDARLALQTVTPDDGIGYQRVGGHDAAEQQRGERRVVEQADTRRVGHDERQAEREQAEDAEPRRIALHAFHVHLKRRKEHDVVKPHLAEQLERVVARQNVEAVLADGHAGEHHAYDVGDAQLAHYYRREEDYEQHHEEDECGVGYGEIAGYVGHIGLFWSMECSWGALGLHSDHCKFIQKFRIKRRLK